MPSFLERARGRLVRDWRRVAYRFWRAAKGPGLTTSAPIQLIGCDRSGTSITSAMFCRHPDVVDFRATRRLWDPYNTWNPEANHYWTAKDLTERDADRIRSRFEFERRSSGAKRVFNQHNNNSVRIAYVRAVFPDVYFIHAIRDGRAVVESIVRLLRRDRHRHLDRLGWLTKPPGWRKLLREDPVEQAALQWRAVVEHILARAETLGDTYAESRYENLCNDCRGEIGRMWRFCGLRCDEETLNLLPEKLLSEDKKWETRLTPEQIKMVNEIQGPLLRRLGYQVDDAS